MDLTLDNILTPSEDVVARVIENELVIVPLVTGLRGMDGELYTMNETGKAIWSRLDGKRTLRAIAKEMAEEFSVTLCLIEKDILGLMNELERQNMVVVQ